MKKFTFEQFEKAATESGLLREFSQADIELARGDPDAGMTLLSYKRDWHNAVTDDQRALANAGAEAVRNEHGGYTAGSGGAEYYRSDGASSWTGDGGDYVSPYAHEIDSLRKKLEGSGFDWSADSDPAVSAYRKAYAREGERAGRNALGEAAAATGGIPSTAAVSASQQAGNYYAAQGADMEAQLYQRAYDNYLKKASADLSLLEALGELEGSNYGVFATETARKAELVPETAPQLRYVYADAEQAQEEKGIPTVIYVDGYGEMTYADAERLAKQGLLVRTGRGENGEPIYRSAAKKPSSGRISLTR